MSQLATCPKCSHHLAVPQDVSSETHVRCPLCAAEYALGEATQFTPPTFELVGASSLGAAGLGAAGLGAAGLGAAAMHDFSKGDQDDLHGASSLSDDAWDNALGLGENSTGEMKLGEIDLDEINLDDESALDEPYSSDMTRASLDMSDDPANNDEPGVDDWLKASDNDRDQAKTSELNGAGVGDDLAGIGGAQDEGFAFGSLDDDGGAFPLDEPIELNLDGPADSRQSDDAQAAGNSTHGAILSSDKDEGSLFGGSTNEPSAGLETTTNASEGTTSSADDDASMFGGGDDSMFGSADNENDPFAPEEREEDFAVNLDGSDMGEQPAAVGDEDDNPFKNDDPFKADEDGLGNFSADEGSSTFKDDSSLQPATAAAAVGAVAGGGLADKSQRGRNDKRKPGDTVGGINLPPREKPKKSFGVMGKIALFGIILLPIAIFGMMWGLGRNPLGLAGILPEFMVPPSLKQKAVAQNRVSPAAKPGNTLGIPGANNDAEDPAPTPDVEPVTDPMPPAKVDSPDNSTDPQPDPLDPLSTPVKPPKTPETDPLDPLGDPSKPAADPLSDPLMLDDPLKKPVTPPAPSVDPVIADDPFAPKAAPKKPLEGDPFPSDPTTPPVVEAPATVPAKPVALVKNAPAVAEEDVKNAIAETDRLLGEYKSVEAANGDLRKPKLAYYVGFTQLARAVTFAPISEELQTEANQLLGKIADEPAKAEELAALGGYWATKSDFRKANGDSTGVVVTGVVEEIAPQGALWQTKLSPVGNKGVALNVLSAEKPTAEPKTSVMVLGHIVTDPKENLTGFEGTENEVIWAGKLFDVQAKTDVLPKAKPAAEPAKTPATPAPAPAPADPTDPFADPPADPLKPAAPVEVDKPAADKPASETPDPAKPEPAKPSEVDPLGEPAPADPKPADPNSEEKPEAKPADEKPEAKPEPASDPGDLFDPNAKPEAPKPADPAGE